jgi:hypothetical protein
MNLYIETENGACKNHPALESNLLQAFRSIPAHWELFKRVEKPTPGMYQVLVSEEPVYQKIDSVWTDIWQLREMSAEEKVAKQQAVITAFRTRDLTSNWSAWTLDEATCIMVPPIPRPEVDQVKKDAGIYTVWCGADNNWKDTPVRPEGNNIFDFIAWEWVVETTS